MSKPRADAWILLGSILLALLAGMISLPPWVELVRPYWIGLVLIYWALESPQRVGLGVAFAVGIWADVLFGTLLGEHATRLCVMVFLVLRFRARLRFFPPAQQALAVVVLLLNDRVVTLALRMASGEGLPAASFWLAPWTGLVIWPLLYLLMDRWRMRARARDG
jgi:rod shape-determining protein MreD